jgi:hypothetical protein
MVCEVHTIITSLTVSGIDDLRNSILQTDAIYGLACLRSSARLPEDSEALLSSLISDGQGDCFHSYVHVTDAT